MSIFNEIDKTIDTFFGQCDDTVEKIKEDERCKFIEDNEDMLRDYYFGNFAQHNEDYKGFERWLWDLDSDEMVDIITKVKKDNEK